MRTTALYAGLLTILFLLLSLRVIAARRETRTSLGDGDDLALRHRIRAHGNFAEYAPIGLLLIALAESLTTSGWWLHVLGLTLLAGRSTHALALSRAYVSPPLRIAGMALTFTALTLAALTDLRAAIL